MLKKKTKIVATIGPASDQVEVVERLIQAGMNIARLNFSHGNHTTHKAKIDMLKSLIKQGHNIAIMLDTKGPEIRSGDFEIGSASFKKGDYVDIMMQPLLGNNKVFSVSYPGLINDVKKGGILRFDDGRLSLKIKEIDKSIGALHCLVLNDAVIGNKRNCVIPFGRQSMPFISEQDYRDIVFGCANDIDYIAASFSRNKNDILDIRNILKQQQHEEIQIIAKIESQEGLDNLDEIIQAADGVMVARGDLGVEIAPEDVPVVQRLIVSKCKAAGKPVIVATHMLDSMQKNPSPTRAEVSDVANAIYESSDAIMLSGESASGDFPVESVEMETRIAARIEPLLDNHLLAEEAFNTSQGCYDDAIAFSVVNSALIINAKLIIAFSESGTTAKRISKYRPICPVISVSSNPKVARLVCLNYGVYGVTDGVGHFQQNEESVHKAIEIAEQYGCQKGDTLMLTGGDGKGSTNFMKIVIVE